MPRNTIAITMDTDWADEATVEWALTLFTNNRIPVTVFTTGRYSCLEQRSSLLEIGLHPNPSRHDDYRKSFDEMRRIYPEARGFRTHGLYESSNMLSWTREQGFVYDANVLMWKQPGIVPFRHPSGLTRIPMFWEDDDHFEFEKGWDAASLGLTTPGLKVLDFHPIHLRLNTADPAQYAMARDGGFSREAMDLAYLSSKTRGTRAMAEQIIELIKSKNWKTALLGELI